MRRSSHTPRQLFGLTLTLVGLLSWHSLPIPHPELAVRAAKRVRGAEPTGQTVSRAIANGRVAFVSSEGNAPSDIYTMNPDGSDRKQLTFSQENERDPVWSPDGTKIAFVRYSNNFGEIFVMNADGSDQRRLTQSKFDQSPTWSPDGTKIAFHRIDSITRPSPSSWGLFVMNADGSDQRAVASTSDLQEPAWSPDGLKFAVRNYNGVYLINIGGSNQTQITQPPVPWIHSIGPYFEDHDPAWSPDGSKITFTRCVDSNGFGCNTTSHLWGVNADGSNPTKLTDTLAYTHAWSPDGTKIIFGSVDDSLEPRDLFVMNPDGSGLTNITNTDGTSEQSPSWQPLSFPPVVNPIDDPQFFVRQHYLDFLSREPETSGFNAWLGVLNGCANIFTGPEVPSGCDRILVSQAFFQSPEFQIKGLYTLLFYRAAFGRLPEYAEIIPDMRSVSGQTGDEVYQKRAAFASAFAARPEFTNLYGGMMDQQYVDALLGRYNLQQITTEDPASPEGTGQVTLTRQLLAGALANNSLTRAQVLRAVVQSAEVDAAEYHGAFVAMQYYGYLRRTPEPGGYDAWLRVIRQDPGNIRVMVNGFVNSQEYRLRFGQP